MMIRNYLSIAYRNLLNKSSFVLINVGGLAIGIAVGLLIMLWIFDELSYDRFHHYSDRIYRIVIHGSVNGNAFSQPRTPHPMPLAMADNFPEVETGVSLSPIWSSGLSRARFRIEHQDKVFEETGILTVDSTFFNVFSFRVISGDPLNCLHTVGGIVLTESMASKYFAQADPVGKFLRINGENDLMVTAVVEDVPKQSHFSFDFLVGYPTMKFLDRQHNQGELSDYYTWRDHGHYNYILLKPGAEVKELESRMNQWVWDYLPDYPETGVFSYELQPITRIHLHSDLIWELDNNGNINYVLIFSLVALLIILVACINFMNMAMARYSFRLKEIGVRKAIGSSQTQLIQQFLLESFLSALIALGIALILMELAMPFFREITGKALELKQIFVPDFLAILVAILVFTTLLSGGYPAFYLASSKPLFALKNRNSGGAGSFTFRQGLVIFQFAASFFLVTSTMVIFSQLNYLRNAPTGYDREQVLMVYLQDDKAKAQFHTLKNSLSSLAGIKKVAGTSNMPGGSFNQNSIQKEGETDLLISSEMWCDTEFLELMGISLASGRNFSKLSSADSSETFILNEAAYNSLRLHEDTGQPEVTWYGDSPGTVTGKVIGVVKDFNFHSLHRKVEPLLIQLGNPGYFNYLVVQVSGEDMASVLGDLEETWKKILPGNQFHYAFLDQEYARLYDQEEKMGVIFSFFAGFTLLIAALGLFGLSAFIVNQRTREIGIRRILGASLMEITTLVGWNFLHWILLAIPLAIPLTYLFLNNWLKNFASRGPIGWEYFLLAALAIILAAILPVVNNAMKATKVNALEALRHE